MPQPKLVVIRNPQPKKAYRVEPGKPPPVLISRIWPRSNKEFFELQFLFHQLFIGKGIGKDVKKLIYQYTFFMCNHGCGKGVTQCCWHIDKKLKATHHPGEEEYYCVDCKLLPHHK